MGEFGRGVLGSFWWERLYSRLALDGRDGRGAVREYQMYFDRQV